MPRTDRSRTKVLRLAAMAVGAVTLVVVLFLVVDDSLDADSASSSLKGVTMDLEAASIGWHGASLDGRSGHLEDDLEASITLTSHRFSGASEFQLYLSRDPKFDMTEDCLVQTRSVRLEVGAEVVVPFRTAAYSSTCVDAGVWYVAVRSVDDDHWMPLNDQIEVAGGRADLALANLPREVGQGEPITITVDAYREMTVSGLAGLWQHPADVWLKQGDQLCVVEADRLTLPRDATRGVDGSQKMTRIQIQVQGMGALRVASDLELKEAVVTGRGGVSVDGPCPLGEGDWEVAVGPASAGTIKTGRLYVHAAPVSVDATPIELTLAQGELTTVERQAFNPSRRPVSWEVAAGDFMAEDWLIGMTGQRLDGGSGTPLTFSISAADLQPGFYRGELKFRAEDYYGTEIAIPVELTVRPGRRVVAESEQNPSSSFEIGNYPNPFNSRTTIRLQLQESGNVRLAVYDVTGREVRRLMDEWTESGMHEVIFDADDLPSGTYLYRIVTDTGTLSRSMTLVK